MKRLVVPMFALAASSATATVPEVSNVQFVQDADRKVTITYDLENGPAIITCDILTNAVVAGSGVSIGDRNLRYFSGDINRRINGESGKKSSHTITWQADKSWPDHKISTDSVRAKVTAWALDNPPDYMVIDLVKPSGASTYDIAYYTSSNAIPGGLLADESYRTTKLVMKRVRAPESGSYVAGNLAEPGHRTEEVQHSMVLTNDYWLGVFQLTQGQYLQIMGSWPGSKFTGDERRLRPVENIAFNGLRGGVYYPTAPTSGTSASVLGTVATASGYAMDFPSETQWEFAARAGNIEGYWPNGVPISTTVATTANTEEPTLSRLAWVNVTTGGDGTRPVGTKEPNGWGFYDMLGNVNEYCLDFYKASRTDSDGRIILASESDDGDKVATRGGCYWEQWYNCRTSRRAGLAKGTANQTTGLRLCCPILPKD